MSIQSLPVDIQLIIQTWEHIARDSGFKPESMQDKHMLVLSGRAKWFRDHPFVGTADVRIRFLARPYQLFLKEMSIEFFPDHPKSTHDYRMLKGETLAAFYHQRLVPDFMPENRPCSFVVSCPQSLVVLLARHNFVSSIVRYPVMFTSLVGKTIAE